MSLEQHPYLLIYLIGSLLVVFLIFFRIALFYIINWITKANIFKKNIEKLAKPDNTAWYHRVLKSLGVLLFEAALSWINVIILLGQMAYEILRVLREGFTPIPEEIKSLRFPLRNNPMLSKEAVWAYLTALNVKAGEALQNENEILASIEEIIDNRPDFNCQNALEQLDSLKVMNSESISSIKKYFATKKYIATKNIIDEDLNEFDFDLSFNSNHEDERK